MAGDNEDAVLKQQLESLEGQLSQLTALLVGDVVDSQSPLVQLQVCSTIPHAGASCSQAG